MRILRVGNVEKMWDNQLNSHIYLPDGYVPSEDESFMNDRQLEFFRRKLVAWRNEIIVESRETIEDLQKQRRKLPDVADQAMEESARSLTLRTRDRQRKLVAKIDGALKRIETGDFGYCEATGRPISLKRLIARPVATYCLEAQEQHERSERVYRFD